MRAAFQHVRDEFRPMLALAWPVVVAELGWMFMGVVDTIMVGRVSPEAIGAVGLGSTVFVAFAIFGMGLLLGLDTFVSQSFGAGAIEECHRWLVHGLFLALIASVPVMAAAWMLVSLMPGWGLHPAVLAITAPYLGIVTWSTVPLLLYAALRRYLQAMNLVRPVMIALVTANLVNAVVNWILIFGHLGFPALGTDGSAWATVAARVYLVVVLALAIGLHERGARVRLAATPLRIEARRIWRLVRLGLPAATQVTAEVGVFAAATALAGQIDPIALTSHQIALNVASVTFMVPFGVASAGAVRVGQAVGRGDTHAASQAGWTAIVLGVGFMACAALAFLIVPSQIIGLFTYDPEVVALGISLLFVAAFFQLFDGLQTVATGVLRGLGDTRTPMLSNLAAHWLVGLPIGYTLCFHGGWGVVGLWIGLSLGLVGVGLVLLSTWAAKVRTLRVHGVLMALQ
jgi:MATE family, multidrug efflux pump